VLKLYFHTSPNPMKIALFLEETGIPYQLVPVDTFKGEQHRPEYLAINPNARTPAITQDGMRVFDSTAILLHLAERSGQLLGSPTTRGEMLSWLMFVATGIAPMGGQLVHFTRVKPDESTYVTNRYRRETQRLYGVLDARLAAAEYLSGPDYTIADVSAWGWIRISDFVLGDGRLADYPNVSRWFSAVDSRPAAARARTLAERSRFKKDFDEETMRAMFPQNYA
jgi:GSH-dependent disulfide-bond oxidoreductase